MVQKRFPTMYLPWIALFGRQGYFVIPVISVCYNGLLLRNST